MADDWRETMNNKRKEGKFCDFKIVVKETTFPVHRIVLDTFSDYFNAMFSNDMQESKQGCCELVGFTPRTGRVVIDFLYTGKLELSLDTAEEVLKLCHMWQLLEAVDKCEVFLKDNINRSNCITHRKMAQLYELRKLENASDKFIFDNLEELEGKAVNADLGLGDILALLNSAPANDVSAVVLWRFIANWGMSRNMLGSNEMCKATEAFPMKKLSLQDMRQLVWLDDHVQFCRKCRCFVGNKILNAASKNPRWQDAIFLRQLSREFHNDAMLELTKTLVIEHHFEVFQGTEFPGVVKEDMLHFVSNIDHECTVEELSAIISWMSLDAGRHDMFPELIGCKKTEKGEKISTFQKSMSSSMNLFDPNYSGTCAKPPWQEIYFIKALAHKYGCSSFEEKLDQHIIDCFSDFCKLDGFKELESSDVVKYVSSSQVELDEQALWGAILKWTEGALVSRKKLLPDLLRSLPVGRFSLKFIRGEILNSPLVANSKSNLSIVMMILLDKFDNMEKELGKLEAREKENAEKLENFQKMSSNECEILVRVAKDLERTENENKTLRELINGLTKRLDDVERQYMEERQTSYADCEKREKSVEDIVGDKVTNNRSSKGNATGCHNAENRGRSESETDDLHTVEYISFDGAGNRVPDLASSSNPNKEAPINWESAKLDLSEFDPFASRRGKWRPPCRTPIAKDIPRPRRRFRKKILAD